MYTSSFERSLRGEKQGKHPKNPSFSSILLDEIFNSIDGTEQNPKETKHFRNVTTSNCKEVEEIESLKRACLMEKLMEKKTNAKVSSTKISSLPELDNIRTFPDFDPMFFSTSSSSSSDSSSGGLSSSDAELFYSSSSTKSRIVTSCFSAKTSSKTNKSSANVPPRPRRNNQRDSYNYKQSECYLFDDYYNPNQEMNGNESEDNLMKSKSRALRVYNNIKKVKVPISPGGRLTSFITSLFTSGNVKRSKEDGKYERKGKPIKISSTSASTCSSASSVSRSCLSKSAPNSRGKFDDLGVRKTVHFYPVSVIVDEDSRPCGHKPIYIEDNEEFDRFQRQPRPHQSSETLKSHVLEMNKNIDQEAARDVFLKRWMEQEKDDDIAEGRNTRDFDDEEDSDVARVSNSSSDLFEIDHLGFCDELPVYETTHLDRNRAIASSVKF